MRYPDDDELIQASIDTSCLQYAVVDHCDSMDVQSRCGGAIAPSCTCDTVILCSDRTHSKMAMERSTMTMLGSIGPEWTPLPCNCLLVTVVIQWLCSGSTAAQRRPQWLPLRTRRDASMRMIYHSQLRKLGGICSLRLWRSSFAYSQLLMTRGSHPSTLLSAWTMSRS